MDTRNSTRPCVERLEDRQVPSATTLVDSLYVNLLGRPADADGEAHWVGQLNSGVSFEQVTRQFMNTPEFLKRAVTQNYWTILGRLPDQGGQDYWIGYLQKGGTFEGMQAQLVASDEYLAGPGAGTNKQYVEALYGTLLARPGDTDGIDYFTGLLDAGQARQSVAAQMIASQEWRTDWVKTDYAALLGRAADDGGLTYWTGQMAQGKTEMDVLAALAGSQEYRDKYDT